MAQMNLSMKQEETHKHREQTCDCQGEWGAGRTGSLGLANANSYIKNKEQSPTDAGHYS